MLRRLVWQQCTEVVDDALRHGIKVYFFFTRAGTIHSVQELCALFNHLGTTMAQYIYLYLWILVVNDALWFPWRVIATPNTFNVGWVGAREELPCRNQKSWLEPMWPLK